MDTPVLYLVFNRLALVKKTFPAIAKAKPKQLFIACDGGRNLKEKKIVNDIKRYILNNIDWNCKIKILSRDKNLGCKLAVSGAIDWFFEYVEEGIILEDDCLPNEKFFKFCEEMLEKHRDNKKVLSITGYNLLKDLKIEESYYFSKYFKCWGWATWKDAWKKCDIEMNNYSNNVFPASIEKIIWSKRFRDNANGVINSWAYCFSYAHFKFKGLCVTPKYSLVRNLGFLENATHSSGNKIDNKYLDTRRNSKMKFTKQKPQEVLTENKHGILNFENLYSVCLFNNLLIFQTAICSPENFIFPDGKILSFFLKAEQVRGPSFMKNFLETNTNKNLKHVFVGPKEEELLLLKRKYPHLKNAETYNLPYIKDVVFPEKEVKALAKRLRKIKPDYVWMCIGNPKQEILSNQLFKEHKTFYFNVGAAMDFLTDKKKEAPPIFTKIGLEWFYRLITDFENSKTKVYKSLIGLKYINRLGFVDFPLVHPKEIRLNKKLSKREQNHDLKRLVMKTISRI